MNFKESIQLKINDWNRFNPRKDDKKHSWFRFENDFFIKTFAWTTEEQVLFTYLCCCKSISKKDIISVQSKLACAVIRQTPKKLLHNLKSLESRGVITLSLDKVLETVGVPTNERTNERTTTLSSDDDHLLVEVWNKECGPLPKVKELNQKRKRLCKEALKKNKDPDYWKQLVKKLLTSKFHLGENDRGWKASFDYFLRPEVQTQLLEGSIGSKSNPFVVPD